MWSGLGSTTENSPRPKAPATATQLRANHDFVINLVCWSDGVVLSSTGELYPIDPAVTRQGMEASLLRTIQQMVCAARPRCATASRPTSR